MWELCESRLTLQRPLYRINFSAFSKFHCAVCAFRLVLLLPSLTQMIFSSLLLTGRLISLRCREQHGLLLPIMRPTGSEVRVVQNSERIGLIVRVGNIIR